MAETVVRTGKKGPTSVPSPSKPKFPHGFYPPEAVPQKVKPPTSPSRDYGKVDQNSVSRIFGV